MNSLVHRQPRPSPHDAAIARSTRETLSSLCSTEQSLKLRAQGDSREQIIHLPAGAVGLLLHALEAMAEGRGFALIPESAEVTTIQAADILNVSRPFLIKLLDQQAIPHRKVGKHRRIRMEDVVAYKKAIDSEREQILEQLTYSAQAQDMGYGSR